MTNENHFINVDIVDALEVGNVAVLFLCFDHSSMRPIANVSKILRQPNVTHAAID